MEYKQIKLLVIFSIIIGFIFSIAIGFYANIYIIAGDLGKGTSYFLTFTSTIIVIESFALFIIYPILFLRLKRKTISNTTSK